jgi:Protein of unknown function (DUF1360)
MFNLLEMGLVVGVISVTVTRGSIFSFFREWMWRYGEWIGNLFSCPYCLAHWVGLWIVLWGNPGLVHRPYELVISVFSVVGISMVCGWIVYKSYKGIVDQPDMSGENIVLREALEKAKVALEEMRGR